MGKVDFHKTRKAWEIKHFKFIVFLNISGEAENPYNSRNIGKVNFLSTEKIWENTEIFHILRYLTDLELMRTHAILIVWECANVHKI